MTTFLAEIRGVALVERDELTRKLMRDVANDIELAVKKLAADPTDLNLQKVNGFWARAHRVMGWASNPTDDGGKGGRMALAA